MEADDGGGSFILIYKEAALIYYVRNHMECIVLRREWIDNKRNR